MSDAIKAILLATIAGLVLGFGLYKSDIFVFVKDRELQNLFENNKDNIIKLRELREKLRIERNL